jgi:DNA-binding IclR family transcriptional regulator
MTPPSSPRSASSNLSIEKAARLLGLFSLDEQDLDLTQIAERLETSKPSAYRWASTLRRAGLLRIYQGRYSLGPRIVELATIALASLTVVRIASSHLERLVRETNETAVLTIWDGEAPVIARVEDSTDHLVRVTVRVGTRLPLQSAQGSLFKAFLLGTDDSQSKKTRQKKFAYSNAVVEGIAVLAVPVFQGDEVVATIGLCGIEHRIPTTPEGPLGTRLRESAEALSLELGFVEDSPRT